AVPGAIAVEVTAARVRNTAEVEKAIAKLGREPGGGLIVAAARSAAGTRGGLAQRQVAVIVGPNTAMRVVRTATSTIPIVFVSGGDPIETGLVTNLSRPDGNITGVSFASTSLGPKPLGLLHEFVPPPAPLAWLRDPGDPTFEGHEKEMPPAARELGRQLLALNAQSVGEIDASFATIVQSRAGALLIGNSILFNNRRRQLAALAARHGVP